MTRVLVVHASRNGSVEEVARYVAAILRDRGVSCTVVPAREAEHVDANDLVVLGTGLPSGRLHREARRFLRRHQDELCQLPFAVFAVGPPSGDRAERERVRLQLEHDLERYPGATPVATGIFGGVIASARVSLPFTYLSPGDYRDWDEIRAFALALPVRDAVPT